MRRSLPTLRLLATLAVAFLFGSSYRENLGFCDAPSSDSRPARAPAHVDSLVWRIPEMTAFVHESLRQIEFHDRKDTRFSGFTYQGSGKIAIIQSWSAKTGFGSPPQSTDTGWAYSPDSARAVYIYRYLGEPDNDLEIFNRRGDSLVEQLEFCGTPCRYLGVKWSDDDRVVFVKAVEVLEERIENGQRYLPLVGFTAIVSLYDLNCDSVYVFESEPIRTK